MSQELTFIMKCPKCEGRLDVQQGHKFVWLQCRTCGKKTKALLKEGMWED